MKLNVFALCLCLTFTLHTLTVPSNEESLDPPKREEIIEASAWAESELWHAATTGDYNRVTSLLKSDVNPNPFHPLKHRFLLQELKELRRICVNTQQIEPDVFLQNREYCDECEGYCKEIECIKKDIILAIVHQLLIRQHNGDPANFEGFIDPRDIVANDLQEDDPHRTKLSPKDACNKDHQELTLEHNLFPY